MTDIAQSGGMAAFPVSRTKAVRVLPGLREELWLIEGPASPEGAPGWIIEDPSRGRFFHLGPEAFEMLSRWHLGEAGAIAKAVSEETAFKIDRPTVEAFAAFLRANNLLQAEGPGGLSRLDLQAQARRLSPLRWLLLNYLFFKVPLLRPDRFLEATQALAAPFFSRTVWSAIFLLGLAGLYLASRQWDSFIGTFDVFATAKGALLAGVTIFLAKVVHELGHAYTAKRHGCRIPTMGIAFLVLWPVLYTDTTDAWRLSSRRARLQIGSAGVISEIGLACLATFLWNFLPEGAARSAVFLVASTTWVLTLAINLNPFMRFDGYYLLSDLLGVPNLQQRAFAHARWRLREWLFALGDPVPEVFAPNRRRWLLLYAYATWLYRLAVFLAIAAAIYYLFFKLLGLILVAAALGWFVLRPVLQEAGLWWRRRDAARPTRGGLMILALFMAGLALLVLPWQRSVSLPAVFQASSSATVYSKASGRVAAIHWEEGQEVQAGAPLFTLEQPDLAFRFAQIEAEARMLQTRILRQAASDEERAVARVLESRLATTLAGYESLLDWRENLEVTAAQVGRVLATVETPRIGEWINASVPLALVVDYGEGKILAYAEAEELRLIEEGAKARFCPDDPLRPCREAEVSRASRINQAVLASPALASSQGGPIAVEPGPEPVPRRALYEIELSVEGEAPERGLVGAVSIETAGHSPLGAVVKRVQTVLIRESGF